MKNWKAVASKGPQWLRRLWPNWWRNSPLTLVWPLMRSMRWQVTSKARSWLSLRSLIRGRTTRRRSMISFLWRSWLHWTRKWLSLTRVTSLRGPAWQDSLLPFLTLSKAASTFSARNLNQMRMSRKPRLRSWQWTCHCMHVLYPHLRQTRKSSKETWPCSWSPQNRRC